MANLLTQNPVKIDTAMASSYKTLTASTLGTLWTLRVGKIIIEVASGSAAGTVTVTDGAGTTLYTVPVNAPATGATLTLEEDWTAHPVLWTDFQVAAVPAGFTIYFFLR